MQQDYHEREKSLALHIREEAEDPRGVAEEWIDLMDICWVERKILECWEWDYKTCQELAAGTRREAFFSHGTNGRVDTRDEKEGIPFYF